MKTIYLHGSLKEKFGEKFAFEVSTPREAIRALMSQLTLKRFKHDFTTELRNGSFQIFRGQLEKEYDMDAEELCMSFGSQNEMHIFPVVHGAGGGKGMGIGKIIVGVVVVAVAAYFTMGAGLALGATMFTVAGVSVTGTSVAMVGAALILSGVSTLLTPTPQVGNYEGRESPAERPSFLFNGAVNTQTQGCAIPLVYGRIRTGSVVVSTGISSEEM